MKISFLKSIFLFAGVLSLSGSCEKSTLTIDAPNCIENKINELKSKEVQNPPAQVWKWEVDDQTYYYITSDCCDQYNYLYTANCEVVCAPDGGLIGTGDGKCPDFNGSIEKTLVWKDPRK